MEYTINNIKLSFKISLTPLDNVEKVLESINVTYKKFHNYMVFKINDIHYVLFKENTKKKCNHLNVTKIPSLQKILEIKNFIEKLLSCSILIEQVDNIMATSQMSHTLDLKHLAQYSLRHIAKYNAETFPGLFLKFKEGTLILFHSGKIVIVGCKEEQHIVWLLTRLCALILMK